MRLHNYILVLLLAAGLAACGSDDSDDGGNGGSGGYSGKTSAAKVNDENSQDIGTGVHIAAKKSVESEINGDNVGIGFSAGNQSPLPEVLKPMHDNVQSILNVRSSARNTSGTVDYTEYFCTSGSASYTYDYSDDMERGTLSFTYNNCTYSYSYGDTTSSYTYDGTYYYEFRPGFWLWDYNLTISYSYNGESDQYTMKGTMECTGDGETWTYTDCSYSETYSEDGVTYRVSNLTFSSTGSSYSFTARIYHSDYGYVEVVATDLIYCVGGGFSNGTITVSDSESSDVLSISYSGCDAPAVITYQGTTYMVDQ